MESKEFMSLVEAAMSVVINEDHMKGKEVIVFGKRGMVIKEVGSDGDTENDEIYQVKFEDGTVKNVPARDMEMQSDKREPSENELEDIANESVDKGHHKYSITNIQHDTGKKKVKGLPTSMTVDVPHHAQGDEDSVIDHINDAISNETGWTHHGYDHKRIKNESVELDEDYKEMMKWYETSNEKKVYAILKKNNIKLPAEGFTLVQNMLKKHRDNVKKAADEIMNKHYPHLKESVDELDEAKSFRDYTTPASPKLKKWIESGKQKYILNVVSVLGPTTRFVVVENPNWFKSGDSKIHDKVLMFTISDPKKGRIKMFAFHGSHVSHQKAMQFAKNNKLVAKEDAKGNPLYAKESVSLDETPHVFPDDDHAKQFHLDIENSAIGTGDRVGNEVTVKGVPSKWRHAVRNFMKKNKGKFIKDSVELDENGVEAAHKGSCEEIHPDMPHEHWEKKKKSAYNVPNAMELLKKFNLKGNDESGTPGFTNEERNYERGDYVKGRRGNHKDQVYVVHKNNPDEPHMVVRVPREGKRDRLMQAAPSNYNRVPNGERFKKINFPGPKPR